MAASDLALRILISARDTASGVVGGLIGKITALAATIASLLGMRSLAAYLADAVSVAGDLQQQMSVLAQATGAVPEQLARLKQAAEEVADSPLPYTAAQAAGGQIELAKAGQSVDEVLRSLPSVLNLAAAGEMEVARAAGIVTGALAVFRLGAADSGRVADVLAAGANSSKTSIQGLSEALSYAGPIAAAAGYSLQQTVALLGKMADGGIDASRGGTALNSILSQLEDPASAASVALSSMGETSRDLNSVLGTLAKGGGMAERAILAFGLEAGPGLRTLIAAGVAGVADLEGKITGVGGAAQSAAEAMQQTLRGAFSDLASVWESIKSKLGEGLLGPLEREIRRVSGDLRTWIGSGQLEQLRVVLVSAFEAAAAAARQMITDWDLPGMIAQIAAWGEQSGAILDEWRGRVQVIGEVTTQVVSGMGAAWEGFRGIVLFVFAAVAEGLGVLTWGFANLATLGNKLGLVTDSVAESARQAHTDMVASAQRYGTDSEAAFRAAEEAAKRAMAGHDEAAKAAEEGAVKTAKAAEEAAAKVTAAAAQQEYAAGLTADQFERLGESVQGFDGAAWTFVAGAQAAAAASTTAGAAVQQQGYAVDGAAVAMREWSAKTGQWVTVAQQATGAALQGEAATRAAAAAAAAAAARVKEEAEALRLLIESQRAEVDVLGRATALIDRQGQARLLHIQNLREEALARGYVDTAARLGRDLEEAGIAVAKDAAAARAKEAAAALALAASLRDQAAAAGDTSTATRAAIAAAEDAAAAKTADSEAAKEAVRHEQALAAAKREGAEAAKESTAAAQKEAAARSGAAAAATGAGATGGGTRTRTGGTAGAGAGTSNSDDRLNSDWVGRRETTQASSTAPAERTGIATGGGVVAAARGAAPSVAASSSPAPIIINLSVQGQDALRLAASARGGRVSV